MNILVTGANGQLGRCLQDVVNASGNGKPDHFVGEPNYYIFKSHDELDITDQDLVSEFVRDNHICVIVNFAAYTNVNKAQDDRDKAYEVNAMGPMYLALAAKEVGAVLIHISTDYVHGGFHNTPIPNTDPGKDFFKTVEREGCYYGYSKCMGEELILSSGFKNYIILRTSWLCSEYGKNFVKTMYERAINGQESSVVFDQVGCITDARDLALFVYQLIEENSSKTPLLSQFGTYNFTANAKKADLVRAVFRFMQIGSIAGFNNYYSAALQTANPQTYAAWIRLGELRVKRLTTDFTPEQDAILANLKFLRKNVFLSGQKLRNVAREALQNCGIEFIEVEPFLTAPTPTCAFYWRGYRPVIQFPTTMMDDSKFLEALFHAVAHVLYHPLRTSCLQLGNQTQATTPFDAATAKNAQEIEAETSAQNMLLSEAEECELICCGRFNERRCIQHFSGLFHVRPGILVERLQQQGKISHRTLLNDFKIAV